MNYCTSRFQAIRRDAREVNIGNISIGGNNPIRIQSMTTTNPEDIAATVAESIKLAEAGCEIVRITAPNVKAAQALKTIRTKLDEARCYVPLVADIHFLPQAAMEAALHVEKVRINPGNYADKKKFVQLEYTDKAYQEELERIYTAVSPLILRCKELGRAMRIGTNHGSLSDRIMNRYGDTPLGMVESALEFIRIAQSHGYYDIVLSMKASNPKVMIEAYRLAAAKMAEENMAFPLHLGVTEAGDGEDGRIKSAIGIGTLLFDGLGDTIRVSLTEDPVHEIPIALELAKRAEALWKRPLVDHADLLIDTIDPYSYNRRESLEITLSNNTGLGQDHFPRVILRLDDALHDGVKAVRTVLDIHARYKENRVEGLLFPLQKPEEVPALLTLIQVLEANVPSFWVEINTVEALKALSTLSKPQIGRIGLVIKTQTIELSDGLAAAQALDAFLSLDTHPEFIKEHALLLKAHEGLLVFTCSQPLTTLHAIGTYRALAEALKEHGIESPIWLRSTAAMTTLPHESHRTACLLESSILLGSLLCDGIGDCVSVEGEEDPAAAIVLAYNILQGTRNRFSKTEFVACPSCGRTLFNLEETTQKIRAKTTHLKGVTIAIMGCIVNGPGEMADADFGYVGGAPGKVNLYVKKNCVEHNIPQAEAVERLVNLIKSHGRWVEPE